ncbi:MAG TPA: acyltransferase [Rhodanobacter sp.]|nr:acyltransferase [Rhodanobacter sp.]
MAHSPNRIPSLDGFRAISILLVAYGHLCGTHRFPVSTVDYARSLGDVAHLGVLVFFVISGFLITSLLMSEREKTGSISLKQFYFRRVLRIFPAFYALILVVFLASLLGWISLNGRDFAFALTYTINYDAHRSWQVGHLWSLSIEEQFYLLWPLVLLALRERRALVVAIVAIFAAPLVRAGISWIHRGHPHSPLYGMIVFPAMCDYLATGCALALLRPWLLAQGWYARLTASPWLLVTVPVILMITRFSNHALVLLVCSPLLNVCVALLIESSTRHDRTLAGRFLNWKPVAFIGVLSYSLYLWQQLFLDRDSNQWINAFPQNIAFAVVAALLSYFLIERSFLRFRRRLEHATRLPMHTDSVGSVTDTRELVAERAVDTSAGNPPMV